MSFTLSKYVVPPGQREVRELGPPNAGKLGILVDPKHTGETRFCMLPRCSDPGGGGLVHHHERKEQLLFFYTGGGTAVLGTVGCSGNGCSITVRKETFYGRE